MTSIYQVQTVKMTSDFVRYEKATFQTSSEMCNMCSRWIQFLPSLHSFC